MNTKITFYIARHGKTMMNTLDRVQGWCDSPLTDAGIEVAQHLGAGLKDTEFRAAYCSDLRRTRQTTQIILEAKGQSNIPITEYVGFREACFGSYESDPNPTMWRHAALYLHYTSVENMTKDILSGKISYKEVLNAIKELDKMGMAENFAEVEARSQEALLDVARKEAQQGDGNILVVAHGMSILCMLIGLGGDKLLKIPLENASVCKVTYEDGKFTVHSMGDLSYVEKGRANSSL